MYAKGYPHSTLSSYNILAPRSIPCTTSSRQSLANFIFKNVVVTVLMIPSYISRVLYALGRCSCYSPTNIYNPLYPFNLPTIEDLTWGYLRHHCLHRARAPSSTKDCLSYRPVLKQIMGIPQELCYKF